MSAPALEPPAWSRARFLAVLAAVFVVQLSSVFWLSDRGPAPVSPATAPLSMLFAPAEWVEALGLSDPTLFALPHAEGFSGPAWLRQEPLSFPLPAWSEPIEQPPIPPEELGAAFSRYLQTNQFSPVQIAATLDPEMQLPVLPQPELLPADSILELAGDLAGRELLNPFELPPWPATDLLTNTIVELVLDDEGRAFSAKMLSGSGSRDADQFALAKARSARFHPLSRAASQPSSPSTAGLAWGQLVFRWTTLPMPGSNAVPPGIPR